MEKRHEYQVQYRLRNKEKLAAYRKKYWRENKERIMQYPHYHGEKRRATMKKWCDNNLHNYRCGQKLKAMQIVSGLEKPKCKNCGCSDLRALEMNHKNLGGSKERRMRGNQLLYGAIISGKRRTNDLDVLCRICNSKHYLEKKFDLHFEVKFLGLSLSDKERALSRLERFGDK